MASTTTVADIMTRNVLTLREEESLSFVQDDMERLGLRHLPVVDDGKLVGLVTHRDILRYSLSRFERDSLHRSLDAGRRADTFVAEIMTRDVHSVRPTTPLLDAARVMTKNKFGCLPVTEPDGTLVGLVTEHDLVRALAEVLEASERAAA